MTPRLSSSRETRFRYDVEGRLVEMVARNGGTGDQVTRWEYGTTLLESGVARNDLLRAKIYPDGEQSAVFGGSGDRVEYGYNRQGELTRQTDQNATVREFGYDGLGRLKSDAVTTLGSGLDGTVRAVGRSYDERGLLQKVTSYADAAMTTVVNEVAYGYNGAGQETSEAQAHGGATGGGTPQVAYEYASGANNTRRRTKVIYPNGRQLEYRYGAAGSIDDLADRVEKIVDVTGTEQELVQYTRRGVNSTVRIQYLEPGLEMTYLQQTGQPVGDGGDRYKGLDRFNRIEDILWLKTSSAQERDRTEYGFDRANNRTWRRNRRAPEDAYDEKYSYDGLYQLTALTRGNLNQNRTATSGVPWWAESFGYDPTGNWEDYQTRTTGGAVSLEQSRTHNRANEITFIDGANATIGHDGAGNTTRMPSVADWSVGQQLKWDAWNRLVEVSAGATVLGKYRYDGTTRRVWKQSSEGGTPVDRHYYYSDQWQVLEERTGSATTADRQFVWGLRYADDLVLRDRGTSERLYALHDQWHVTAITASSGTVLERYAYHAFGQSEVLANDFTPRTASLYDWEVRYGGYRLDPESGLYQVRYRYLHPQLGRWLSRDPIGEAGGFNLYAYVSSNPLNSIDSLGENQFTDWLRGAAAGAVCYFGGESPEGKNRMPPRVPTAPATQPRPIPPTPPTPPTPPPPPPPPPPGNGTPRSPLRGPIRPAFPRGGGGSLIFCFGPSSALTDLQPIDFNKNGIIEPWEYGTWD